MPSEAVLGTTPGFQIKTHASSCPANGPAMSCPSSRTRMPESGKSWESWFAIVANLHSYDCIRLFDLDRRCDETSTHDFDDERNNWRFKTGKRLISRMKYEGKLGA